jgi:ketosteroid isomerase-like protein
VGTDERLLDDSKRYAAAARERGNDVRLEIWEGMHHVFQAQAGVLRSSGAALERVARFLREGFEINAGAATADVVRRFIAAFQRKDTAAIPDLVAPDCVMEAMQPAPDGQRVEGYDANVAFWQAMVADPNGSFEVEDVVISGDRATNRWRYRFGDGNSVRGVTLIRVRDGRIAEALAYAKVAAVSDLGQAAS